MPTTQPPSAPTPMIPRHHQLSRHVCSGRVASRMRRAMLSQSTGFNVNLGHLVKRPRDVALQVQLRRGVVGLCDAAV